MILNWFSQDYSEGNKQITPQEEEQILAQFQKWISQISEVPEVQVMMTYAEAIDYFQSDMPSHCSVKKGVIIRQEIPEGQLLGQVFLDTNNQLVCRSDGTPYGRQLVAIKLDGQLNINFGNQDLIYVNLKSNKSSFNEFHPRINWQFLSNCFKDLGETREVIPIMTYEDAIKYFITDRPSDPRVKKGYILRQTHPQGQLLAQMFLDSNNEIIDRSDGKPYGRQLVTKKLDAELEDAFDNQDLIIVE
ncbi:hypothetical protein AFK68_21700 [Hydrocoleum sp. CS-953]|uniref:hypothetical protein n=1 Tax=Hydrocoleum sp. CS-953 TaxID=1671698 RepID=UPI000B9A9111|nr:hypothetical protein [Hydrocoleum sp. CS-953]OZH52842.1 hypothetical protein AFK68_21700 [Hydrocoleum sp. CS-953]